MGWHLDGRRPLRSPVRLGALSVAIVLAVALPVLGQPAPVDATSWIDAPLDGAVLPLTPYEVVAHSADQGGVDEVVLSVGGTETGKVAVTGGPRLHTSRFNWTPPGAGTFLLVVRARSARGDWGVPGTATVVVSGAPRSAPSAPGSTAFPTESLPPGATPGPSASPGPTATAGATGSPAATPTGTPGALPTPTPTPTPTRPPPTPTPSPTPTPTPTAAPTVCLPPAPTLTLPSNGSTVYNSTGGNPPSFEWMYDSMPSCAPTTFRMRLSVNRDLSAPLYDVTVSGSGGPIWTWTPSPLPFGLPCPIYYWGVTARASNGAAGGSSATWSFSVCR